MNKKGFGMFENYCMETVIMNKREEGGNGDCIYKQASIKTLSFASVEMEDHRGLRGED